MLIQTGEDLQNSLTTEGIERTVSSLIHSYDLVVHQNSLKYLRIYNCKNTSDHSLDTKQNTWLSVFQDLSKFVNGEKDQGYTQPLGWLLTINRHSCFNHIKRCLKEDKIFDPIDNGVIQTTKTNECSPLEEIIKNQDIKRINLIISTFDQREIQVLQLFYKGVPHTLIGNMLNMTALNSRQILFRSLVKIKQQIGGGLN